MIKSMSFEACGMNSRAGFRLPCCTVFSRRLVHGDAGCAQHVLDADRVAAGGIVDEDIGYHMIPTEKAVFVLLLC